ncbi:MAG: stage II sporulation protein M [Actinomycetota bacterium]
MDIDRELAGRQARWERLEELTERAGRRARLPAPEARELVGLHADAAADLSWLRTRAPEASALPALTTLVAEAGAIVHHDDGGGARPAIGTFFVRTFPAAVWHHRRFVVAAAVFLLAPGLLIGAWLAVSDDAVEASAPEAVREAYITEDFEAYYSSEPAGQFATEVFVNNVQVAILAFAAGALLCVPTVALLAFNGANVGVAGGLFHHAGEAPRFWGLILPHGLLELSAVVIAGAAGLALGWSIVVPGDRRRADALAAEGRRSVSIVLGLVVAFGIAGAIEGFVTPSGLPTWARLAIGAGVWLLFCAYIVLGGVAAARHGLTGLLGERPVTGDHHDMSPSPMTVDAAPSAG